MRKFLAMADSHGEKRKGETMNPYHEKDEFNNDLRRSLEFEMLRYFRRKNEQLDREQFEREQEDIRYRRFGYPPRRRARW